MSADIQCLKNSNNCRFHIGFILVCLAFVAGVLIFRVSGMNIFTGIDKLAFEVFAVGCIFLIFLHLLAAASALGKLLIPLYSLVGGYLISAFSGFIIQFFSDDTPLIIPLALFLSIYTYVFALLVAADSARHSSVLVAKRVFLDTRVRTRFVRTAAAVLTVVLLITVLFAFLSKYIFDTYF